jgi:hypothetical protein
MIVVSIILAVALVAIFIGIALYRKSQNKTQNTAEIIATGVADKVTNMFDLQPPTSQIIYSKFFPDQLYVGKTVKLDPTLKVMFTNLLFGFPDSPLIVGGFSYFDIDGNPFEQIAFDKIGTKSYIMLYDTYEETNYFLNRVMSQGVAKNETPPMAKQDEITLTEKDQTYVYKDFSGLIEVKVRDEIGRFKNNRLIRVYNRELTPDDDEYLICILDKPDVVDYYIGFNISVLQLEDL